MKLTVIGIICILIAIGFAGNWLSPSILKMQTYESFEPIPGYPKDDPADAVHRSNITFISTLNMSYIEFSYVWFNDAIDTQRVSIFIKDGDVHHVSLYIHNTWVDEYNFTIDGTNIHISFLPVTHTPYTSKKLLATATMDRAIPILIPLGLGFGLIYLDYKLIEISARAKIAKGFKKYSIRARWNMIFGKNK